MPYRPNYCSHCGERVERSEWRIWTSSRFCENCEGAFKQTDWLPKIGLMLAGVGGLFGFGSYLRTPEKNLAVANNQFSVSLANKPQPVRNEHVAVNQNASSPSGIRVAQPTVTAQNQGKVSILQKENLPPAATKTPQIVEAEPVYFCGAQTKKGTPCSRKVKGATRCWQHVGLPAMLPTEKLSAGQ